MNRVRDAVTVATNACKQLGQSPRALTVRFLFHLLTIFLRFWLVCNLITKNNDILLQKCLQKF